MNYLLLSVLVRIPSPIEPFRHVFASACSVDFRVTSDHSAPGHGRGSYLTFSDEYGTSVLWRQRLEVVIGGKVLEEVALLLHDAVELIKVDLAITITVSLVDHVLELLVIDVLSELLGHAGKVAEGDLVGVVVVEQLEHLLDALAGVLLAHLAGHHLKEFTELDGAVAVTVDISDHLLELLVLDFEAECTHGGLELTYVDGAGCVTVEKAECLTDLLELLLGKSSLLLC